MPSSISIPEELHEAIIDELACHTILPPRQDQHQKALINYKSSLETLQACSLVSQSFARRAQGHIYSTLIIRCADSSIVDKKMTKREADKRSNRLNAISDICASKPHIKRSIQSLFIDMTNSGNSPTSLFPPDTQALHDFLSLCDNVTSIYISGRPLTLGRKHTTRPPPVVSLRRLLPKSFRIDQISKCHIWNARLDFGAVGDLVNLSDMSLSSVRFLNYNYLGALSDRQYPLRIRRLYLEHVEDDVLDLLIHNDYGRGPAEHPILDLSTLREFRLGPQRHQYDNRPGYVYTLQQLLEKSLLSLEELELSVLPFSGGWIRKEDHLPAPNPSVTLDHPRLMELVIGSTAVSIDYPGRSSFPPTQIKTWLEAVPAGATLALSLAFRFKTSKRPQRGEASALVSCCDYVIDWTSLCSEIARIADGRPLVFSLDVVCVYSPVVGKAPAAQQDILHQLNLALEKEFYPVLRVVLRQLLPMYVTPKITYSATIPIPQ